MRSISSLNQAQFKSVQLNRQKYANGNYHSFISFKGEINVDKSKLNSVDSVNICRPLLQYTRLFRDGLIESLNQITEEFSGKLDPKKKPPEKPVKFYVYGCSDGHETYSIIMYLVKKYGSLKEAKKRVEIHSIDIPSPGLEMAKSRKLHIDVDDLISLNENTRAYRPTFESITSNKDIYSNVKSTTPIKIKDAIFEYANFKEGRILEDFGKNGKFNEKEPVVVFFRNALSYIKRRKAYSLIYNLYSKLPKGSLFCIGDYDQSCDGKGQFRAVKNTFKPMRFNRYAEPYLFKKPSWPSLKFINFNWLRILLNKLH